MTEFSTSAEFEKVQLTPAEIIELKARFLDDPRTVPSIAAWRATEYLEVIGDRNVESSEITMDQLQMVAVIAAEGARDLHAALGLPGHQWPEAMLSTVETKNLLDEYETSLQDGKLTPMSSVVINSGVQHG